MQIEKTETYALTLTRAELHAIRDALNVYTPENVPTNKIVRALWETITDALALP